MPMIRGPVVIGDGRFCGLGLMEPITHYDAVLVLELDTRTRIAPACDGDPLLGPATTWVSRTPYLATRNFRKGDDPASTIEMDVRAECRRRGLPAPLEVGVPEVDAGRRGGRPTARLKLRFAVAVRSPLLLGRDSHAGGGLFHAR